MRHTRGKKNKAVEAKGGYLEIHIKDGNLMVVPLNKSNKNLIKRISGSRKRIESVYCG